MTDADKKLSMMPPGQVPVCPVKDHMPDGSHIQWRGLSYLDAYALALIAGGDKSPPEELFRKAKTYVDSRAGQRTQRTQKPNLYGEKVKHLLENLKRKGKL